MSRKRVRPSPRLAGSRPATGRHPRRGVQRRSIGYDAPWSWGFGEGLQQAGPVAFPCEWKPGPVALSVKRGIENKSIILSIYTPKDSNAQTRSKPLVPFHVEEVVKKTYAK